MRCAARDAMRGWCAARDAMQRAARGLVAVASAGGAMLWTMVFFGGWRGFKEWADGWAEGEGKGWVQGLVSLI